MFFAFLWLSWVISLLLEGLEAAWCPHVHEGCAVPSDARRTASPGLSDTAAGHGCHVHERHVHERHVHQRAGRHAGKTRGRSAKGSRHSRSACGSRGKHGEAATPMRSLDGDHLLHL